MELFPMKQSSDLSARLTRPCSRPLRAQDPSYFGSFCGALAAADGQPVGPHSSLSVREVENTINRDLFVPSRIRLQLCGCLCYQPLWFRRLNDLVLRMQVPDRVIGSK